MELTPTVTPTATTRAGGSRKSQTRSPANCNTSITYNAASNLTKRYNWVNTVAQKYTYNPLDWITPRDLLKGTSATLASETYSHNPLGQVTLIDRSGTNDDRFGINQYTTANGVSVTNGPAEHQISSFNGITFGYMNDGQLTYVSNGTSSMNFAYDALGRCVKRVKDGWDAKYNFYDGERELLECGPAGVFSRKTFRS